MKIGINKMVSLIYELREGDSEGRVIETLDETRPLAFVYGTGRLLPVFESNIDLLEKGDLFKFTLNSEIAYGERREDMIIDVPISVFVTDGKLNEDICRVGNEVPMMDNEGNHPMADLNLFFSGKIVDVRDATESELSPMASSCSGCGSEGKSDCSGGCS
jgi:FKBP-type peptidyl-prolyl cis-trans isomerase SlyD